MCVLLLFVTTYCVHCIFQLNFHGGGGGGGEESSPTPIVSYMHDNNLMLLSLIEEIRII